MTHLEVNKLPCCREETINLMYSNNEEMLDDVHDLFDDVFSVEELWELNVRKSRSKTWLNVKKCIHHKR